MSSVLRAPPFRAPPTIQISNSLSSRRLFCSSFRYGGPKASRIGNSLQLSHRLSKRFARLVPFASHGEAAEVEQVQESVTQDDSDGAIHGENTVSDSDISDVEELPSSAVVASLQSYREALERNDDSKLAEVEAFIQSIEDEKTYLENKVDTLSKELSYEKERILRISADFDNFRKRTERDRFSVLTNAQGEVVENLLPVLDNFDRAKTQIKVETKGEEKINGSYQSIYKQFVEVLGSLGVVTVETTGNPFDPLLHEAIMREESTEFEEGIIMQEFRKGFKLGDRLLRPSMVKVSAGPGPAKPEPVNQSEETGGIGSGKPEPVEVEQSEGTEASSEIKEGEGLIEVCEEGIAEAQT